MHIVAAAQRKRKACYTGTEINHMTSVWWRVVQFSRVASVWWRGVLQRKNKAQSVKRSMLREKIEENEKFSFLENWADIKSTIVTFLRDCSRN